MFQIISYVQRFRMTDVILGFLCATFVGRLLLMHADAQANDKHCVARADTGGVRMTSNCLREDMLPKLGLQKTVDIVWSHIVDIQNPYNSVDSGFMFTGSAIVLSGIVPYETYKAHYASAYSTIPNTYSIIGKRSFFVPWETIAARELYNYKVVAADRDISQYGNCAKVNFGIGMNALASGIMLQTGASRNANMAFSGLAGYCTGGSNQTYMFYQGICGVTSMVFRASMLEPLIDISKRQGHTDWYTKYYGVTVVGDDAAIYEDIKQFEIRNNGSDYILLRSKRIGDKPYVVILSNTKDCEPVFIQKKPLTELSAQIVRSYGSGTKTWYSNYDQKIDAGN